MHDVGALRQMRNKHEVREKRYLVAAVHAWNRRIFKEKIARLPGRWFFVGDPRDLTLQKVAQRNPRVIFFLHWSWKVPSEILRSYECIGFHMTDLPYGRGGSPLQNLILQGHTQTKLAAFRMDEELDAGPVYRKESLSLEGSAREIYLRASLLAARMIRRFIQGKNRPRPQHGRPVRFVRRRPSESAVPPIPHVKGLYDFIRMLDAPGYPKAFLESDGFRFEFSQAVLKGDHLQAQTRITHAGKVR